MDDGLRVIPEVRSADFERTRDRPGRVVIYRAVYADLDPSSLPPGAVRAGLLRAWLWGLRGGWRVVELPEPLWLRALPLTLSVGVAARIGGLLRGRRPVLVTYAMENNHPARLLKGLPAPLRPVLTGALLALCRLLYDRIAFASDAAMRCYREAGVLPAHTTVREFPDLLAACDREAGVPKERLVTFVAALEQRKGVEPLLSAWGRSGLGAEGWRLRVAGTGPLAERVRKAAERDTSIAFEGQAGRAEVHELLARSTAVVLPSQPEGRWCEQIGLPIVEGLAHGCRVVATPDTGLAGWLAERGHVVLPAGFTAADLAKGLRKAVEAAGPTPEEVRAELPTEAGRVLGEDWMYR